MIRKTTVSLNIPPPPTAEIEEHAQPARCSLPVLTPLMIGHCMRKQGKSNCTAHHSHHQGINKPSFACSRDFVQIDMIMMASDYLLAWKLAEILLLLLYHPITSAVRHDGPLKRSPSKLEIRNMLQWMLTKDVLSLGQENARRLVFYRTGGPGALFFAKREVLGNYLGC